jgi:hypothetical protein
MIDDIKYQVAMNDFGMNFAFYGRMENLDNTYSILMPVVMEKTDIRVSGDLNMRPFMNLTDGTAQKLMDAMYTAGLRPSHYQGQGGKDAMSAHLSEMRKIVSKMCQVDL